MNVNENNSGVNMQGKKSCYCYLLAIQSCQQQATNKF